MNRTKISRTKIEKQMKKKTNPFLIEAIIKLKKKNPEIAKILVRPVKKSLWVNLKDIKKKSEKDRGVFIPGKILGFGEVTNKIKIVAWSASAKAKEKMKKAGVEFVPLIEEIKKNPELKNLELIK